MRKSASLLVLLLLTACSIPFIQQPTAPTQALIPTVAQEVDLVEPLAAEEGAPAVDEGMPVADEGMPVDSCPTCPSVDAGCEDDLASCQAAATEMAATIIAFNAFGGESLSDVTATATPDMSGGMPPLTPTPDMQGGMPTLTATSDPQAMGMPTATLDPAVVGPVDAARYRADAVTYKKNFAHPDKGCNWMGVAGQVLDGSGNPVKNLVVIATGVLQGTDIMQVDITGLHDAYGPGGYEIELGNSVVATTNMIYVTIYDLDGSVLSSPVSIATRADCNQNLLVLNFQLAK